jgi:predicted aspartyl protease
MTFFLDRDPEGGVVYVIALLDTDTRLRFLLDTGASFTTFDSNELLMAGYDLGNPLGTQDSESANGIIQTQLFEVREFAALGISRKNYVVQAMDFLAHGMVSNYQGLLGMDFFEGTKFCIDTVRNQISIEPILV